MTLLVQSSDLKRRGSAKSFEEVFGLGTRNAPGSRDPQCRRFPGANGPSVQGSAMRARNGLRGDHDAASIARLRRFPQSDFGPTTPPAQEFQPNVRVARDTPGAMERGEIRCPPTLRP